VRLRAGSVVVLSFVTSVMPTACRDRPAASDTERVPAPAPMGDAALPVTAPEPSGTLPEDPVAAARSVAEWREHLEREEHERRLSYDRRKLREHQQVLKVLREARDRYDASGTRQAVLNTERAFGSTRPKLAAMFDAIDHWGVSSKVVPDYRKLADTFSAAYPNARLAALSGDPTPFRRLEAEVDARFAAIDAWLREAAAGEDE
jgi:hypothetical protein